MILMLCTVLLCTVHCDVESRMLCVGSREKKDVVAAMCVFFCRHHAKSPHKHKMFYMVDWFRMYKYTTFP